MATSLARLARRHAIRTDRNAIRRAIPASHPLADASHAGRQGHSMSDISLVRDDYHPDPEADGVAVHAGFPNPGADRRTAPLSLDRLLIRHPSSTYFFRVQGHSWADHGIFDGNLALIDRAVKPRPEDLVIYWGGDSFAISRFSRLQHQDEIWGTIISTIHEHHAR